jgi:hypothetical protein
LSENGVHHKKSMVFIIIFKINIPKLSPNSHDLASFSQLKHAIYPPVNVHIVEENPALVDHFPNGFPHGFSTSHASDDHPKLHQKSLFPLLFKVKDIEQPTLGI